MKLRYERVKEKEHMPRLEIVPVGVVRSRIWPKNALKDSALRTSHIPPTRSAHLRYAPRPVLLCAFHSTGTLHTHARHMAPSDNLVFATIGCGNAESAGSEGSSGVARSGVGSRLSAWQADEVV